MWPGVAGVGSAGSRQVAGLQEAAGRQAGDGTVGAGDDTEVADGVVDADDLGGHQGQSELQGDVGKQALDGGEGEDLEVAGEHADAEC